MAITKIRRTQAERTEATKQALIHSAIKLLNSHGYAGATLALIAEDAGVSRGSILHQFGTRAALMIEVVKWVYAEEYALYGELIPKSPHRGHKLSDWPLIVWKVLSRPSATAVVEILQGSRSDADLAEQLRPVQTQIEQSSMSALQAMHAMHVNNPRDRAIIRVVVAAVRGLSLQTLTVDPADLEFAMQMLNDLVRMAEREEEIAATKAAD